MRTCQDCGTRLKNRGKSTKRCQACNLINKAKNAKGRTIGIYCVRCKREVSAKSNTSGLCRRCYLENPLPAWNKGKTGGTPWNKGKTIFQSEEQRIARTNERRRNRYSTLTAKQKIADNIRTLIRNSLVRQRDVKKTTKTFDLLGCNIGQFINHLESQFEPGMSWDNYGNGHGKWNIDHIRPLASYRNLHDPEEQRVAFNFCNCRPMWAVENSRKSDHYDVDISLASQI